jgi:hypothetical protein
MSETEIKDAGKIPCVFCAEPIPILAKWCKQCSAYQRGWWRPRLPIPATMGMITPTLALLGAIFAAIPFVITQWTNYLHRESTTQIAFAGTEGSVIYAHLWNTGLKPSSVRNFCLRLDPVHIEDVELIPIRDATHEVRSLIPPGGEITTLLLVRGLKPRANFARNDVEKALGTNRVTLIGVVEESNGKVSRYDSINAALLRELILQKLQ